jgi:hypothetical protein
MSQLRKSSLTPSHISFRTTTYRRRVSAANPCLSRPTILFCDFNFRSSLFRRLHYFSMFGFDSALPTTTRIVAAPDDFHPRFRYD